MPRTDSRKANQRRRFQKQRKENRQRILEVKYEPKADATPTAPTN